MNGSSGFKVGLEGETVASLPIREAVEVKPTTSIREAVSLMRDKEIGCAVMVEQGKPVGIFTERSLLDVLMSNTSLDSRVVSDFADKDFRTVRASDSVSLVWDAIQKEDLRFFCVIDDDGKLIGLTGQRGLAEHVAEYFPQQVMVQRLGAKPWMAEREGA